MVHTRSKLLISTMIGICFCYVVFFADCAVGFGFGGSNAVARPTIQDINSRGAGSLVTRAWLPVFMLRMFNKIMNFVYMFSPQIVKDFIIEIMSNFRFVLQGDGIYQSLDYEAALARATMDESMLFQLLTKMEEGLLAAEKDRQRGQLKYMLNYWSQVHDSEGNKSCYPATIRDPDSDWFNTYQYKFVYWNKNDRRRNLISHGALAWVHTELDFRKLPTLFCYMMCFWVEQCLRKKYIREAKRSKIRIA